MCMGDELDDGAKLPTHMEYDKRETKYAKTAHKQTEEQSKAKFS